MVAVFSSVRSSFSQGCLDIIRGVLLQGGVIKLPIPDIVWKASHLAVLLLDVLILDVREPLLRVEGILSLAPGEALQRVCKLGWEDGKRSSLW